MRESSGIAGGLISLPTGGGGVASLGERFQPDLVRGSGSYAVPINCPKGPNELRPSLSLTYSTGSGNGPYGLGWRLNIMRIERRTDKGIPAYTDNDTFMIGDAEVLVPVEGYRYRPKADNKFWDIERLSDHWRIRTGDGRTLFFGCSEASREFDEAGIFAWYLNEEQDAAGNRITYSYLRDGGRLYIQKIEYSIFSIHLLYENRPDILRNGRCGFLKTTNWRAKAIELHCQRQTPTLLWTYSLNYESALNGASLLKSMLLFAADNNETAGFPTLTFNYSGLDLNQWEVHNLQALVTPPSLENNYVQLVDLTGDGLPDLLESSNSGIMLWRNRGDGWLGGPDLIADIPTVVNLEKEHVAFADLNGNGRVDLFSAAQRMQVVYESDGRGGFSSIPIVYRESPNIGLESQKTRLTDFDGDGVIDLISSEASHFLLYKHIPGVGWQDPQPVPRITDLEKFPDVKFTDHGVSLADMSGDGLQDIVLVQSGNVCYWPCLGNGSWGNRVEMQNSPQFPPGYRDEYLHVVDLDGDGCSDIVYFDHEATLIWINCSGGSFFGPIVIPVVPVVAKARVLSADFFGDGRPGFIWSASVTSEDSAGYRYLRFDRGNKPYLLTKVNNGMGGEYGIVYSTSTQMRIDDAADGREWLMQLPFPVQLVAKIVEKDLVNGRINEMRIRYHEGVYDGIEREFRGFTQVDVDMIGDESAPASSQVFSFFQGDPEEPDLLQRAYQRALAGALTATKIYELTGSGRKLIYESAQTWDARLEYQDEAKTVYFPYVKQIETREHGATASRQRIERTRLLQYDAYGNYQKRVRESYAEGELPNKWIKTEEQFTFTNNQPAYLVKLPVRLELRDSNGKPFAVKITYYDGLDFTGLPEGSVEKGLVSRVRELKMLSACLPPGYADGIDFLPLGFKLEGVGDTQGYYATTLAVKRDSWGNITLQKDANGISIKIEYDADGVYPVKATDARGKESTFVFNPRSGQPAKVTYTDGRIIRYDYDLMGRLKANYETGADGLERMVKCWVIDIATTPYSVTSIVPGNTPRKREDFESNIDFSSFDDLSVSRVYYDGFGKQLQQITTAPNAPDGLKRYLSSERNKLNVRGLIAEKYPSVYVPDLNYVVPSGDPEVIVRKRYDITGKEVETVGPGQAHFKIIRDSFTISHYENEAADSFGSEAVGTPSRIEYYDARSRLVHIEEKNNDGQVVLTSYELAVDGRIKTISNGTGQVMVEYTFVGPVEPVMISHSNAGSRVYYRDAAGRLLERINPDGSSLYYSYDQAGRMTKIEHSPAGSGQKKIVREIIYDVDPEQPSSGRYLDGRIALVKEVGNTIRYSYSLNGMPVKEEVTVASVTLATEREYDAGGRVKAITYPDGRVISYSMDNSGMITDIPGVASNIRYSEDSSLEGFVLANGVDINMLKDPITRRLSAISAGNSSGILRKLDYTYDSIGNITGIKDNASGSVLEWNFRYDGLHRLSGFDTVSGPGVTGIPPSGNYTYDDEGNIKNISELYNLRLKYNDALHPGRVTEVQNGANTDNISYNTKGQITAYGDLASIEYDAFDRITSVTKLDGTEIGIAYDHLNHRIFKQVKRGSNISTVYYAGSIYEQHDSQALRHIRLGNMLLATEKVALSAPGNSSAVYYLCDHHGSVLLAIDAGGSLIYHQRYTPFGSAINSSTPLDNYLGRDKDSETGLIHLGARYYIPSLGRFTSPDWYVLEKPEKPVRIPQGYNVYAYALNNPLVFKDPSGLWFLIDDLLVLGVGFVVGFVSGLIYGLANGQGWGSFQTALETGFTTAVGAWLGWLVAGPAGLVMGGMNGLLSGLHGVYDFESAEGWFAFASDSTWGLLGTSLGNIVHIINLFYGDANYREDLSRRQNRHVYEGGFALKQDFAFTQGNVISNAGGTKGLDPSTPGGQARLNLLNNHEDLHVWQQRFFGPIFQATYVAWGVGGFIVGTIAWLFNTDESYGSMIETASYYDNPFEYWAYKADNNWLPDGANSTIAW